MTVVEKLNSCWIPDFEGRLDLWACLFLLKLLGFFKVKNSLSIPKSKLRSKDLDKILRESSIPTSQFFSKTVPCIKETPENLTGILQENLKKEKANKTAKGKSQ